MRVDCIAVIVSRFAAGRSRSRSKQRPEQNIKQMVSSMSLEEKIGQMLMPDFRNWKKKGNRAPKD
ncbi:hypothetical protein PO124_33395 [Bacillus licheniformis]|nr:hypothetical protein [Bacillus licheniformis]